MGLRTRTLDRIHSGIEISLNVKRHSDGHRSFLLCNAIVVYASDSIFFSILENPNFSMPYN